MGLLDRIEKPEDLKQFSFAKLAVLCSEIREMLIRSVSNTGGHLSANLGVVELTVALHKVFDLPTDQIIWDVGHQTYTHKILTGRKNQMHTLRQKGGISGFPKPEESEYDAFIAGHSSTSISVASGIARAKSLNHQDGYTIAVIGDGSFTGGLAYEALNNAGRCPDKLIVVLNDNEMSISKNVGAFARYLTQIRTRPGYYAARKAIHKAFSAVPYLGPALVKAVSGSKGFIKELVYHTTLFEDFGFDYIGPVDGHDLEKTCAALARAKQSARPVVVHVDTIKGKGYTPAEQHPDTYHGVSKFDRNNGHFASQGKDYSHVFGDWLVRAARKDPRICAVTAAMKYSTGLNEFSKEFPSRFFDVGIAESHAITFCAGLANAGMLPVFAVYSTFLQRGYDQLMQDAALANMHIVFAVDRAGIVGEDGETHQGVFDVSFLSSIPGMTILQPDGYEELDRVLQWAFYEQNGPVAIRYPKGKSAADQAVFSGGREYQTFGSGEIALVSYGRLSGVCHAAAKELSQQGIDVKVFKFTQIKPYSEEAFGELLAMREIFFVEESVSSGSLSEKIGNRLMQNGYRGKYHTRTIPDRFLAQAKTEEILEDLQMDKQSLKTWIQNEQGMRHETTH